MNFGIPKDYETLDRLGVSVKGAVVITRYGKSWRGIKPKVAAEHGAVGCIIYSDPHEDGYFNGDIFPKGPMRDENGAQRGSVADMPLYPGDPLTPGVAAKGDVKRLSVKDAPTITKIPVLPISYGDAKPLLAALKGPLAPEEFRGALPITYHVGPGPAKVHLKVESNWDIKPVRDIIAKIPGRIHRASGSFAATITTPGSTAPRIPSPARLRFWKKPAPSPSFSSWDGSRIARSFSAPGMAKSPGCSGRRNGAKTMPKNWLPTPPSTLIPTATAGVFSVSRGLILWKNL